jgi:hypothetical protein
MSAPSHPRRAFSGSDVGLVICVSHGRREFLPFINLSVPSVADRTRAELTRIVDEFQRVGRSGDH